MLLYVFYMLSETCATNWELAKIEEIKQCDKNENKIYFVHDFIKWKWLHYSDFIWAPWLIKSPAIRPRLYVQQLVRDNNNEIIKTRHYWYFLGKASGERWIPLTKGQCGSISRSWFRPSAPWKIIPKPRVTVNLMVDSLRLHTHAFSNKTLSLSTFST